VLLFVFFFVLNTKQGCLLLLLVTLFVLLWLRLCSRPSKTETWTRWRAFSRRGRSLTWSFATRADKRCCTSWPRPDGPPSADW
jgi:hypothetical protein